MTALLLILKAVPPWVWAAVAEVLLLVSLYGCQHRKISRLEAKQ